MEGYKVSIAESSKELTAKERIALKDLNNCTKLESELDHGDVTIKPVAYAVIDVHNDYAKDDKDYEVYVIVGDDGEHYRTSSESFFDSFKNIWDEMSNEDEDYSILISRRASKNYEGKYFLTCSIV